MLSHSNKSLARFDADYRRHWRIEHLCGIDEAGRGCLAGPVVAAAVIFQPGLTIRGLNDSKKFKPEKRRELFHKVIKKAHAVAIGWASAEEIDQVNILQATHLAAGRAIAMLRPAPQAFLTDYLKLKISGHAHLEPLVRGDGLSQSIAAASIVAKVTRDRWIERLDAQYPGYGLARHKGYGTPAHIKAIQQLGSSTLHRQTFAGVSWFDAEPMPSLVCQGLIKKAANSKFDVDAALAQWQSIDTYLPESEEAFIKNAYKKRKNTGNPTKIHA